MKNAMEVHGLSDASFEFNHKCAQEKKIIPHTYIEDEAPAGEWGRACLVGGSDGNRGILREIKHFWDPHLPNNYSSLWKLPIGENKEHEHATSNVYHYSNDERCLQSRRLALVRYEHERSSAVADHPNNAVAGGGGWVCEGSDEVIHTYVHT